MYKKRRKQLLTCWRLVCVQIMRQTRKWEITEKKNCCEVAVVKVNGLLKLQNNKLSVVFTARICSSDSEPDLYICANQNWYSAPETLQDFVFYLYIFYICNYCCIFNLNKMISNTNWPKEVMLFKHDNPQPHHITCVR